jgi:hypothetical protein
MSAVADEIWAILKENSLQMGELRESHKEFREEQKALQAAQKETDRILKKLSVDIKEVNTSVGRLTSRLGEFVEEAVRPSAVRLFRERGIDIHEVHQNITSKRDGEALEIDLLVVNNNDVVVIECKSNLSIDDVNEHLERIEKAKRLVASCENKRILGAVAGMVIPNNVAAYAIRKGLYVIGQNGDHLELRNDMSFVAKIW